VIFEYASKRGENKMSNSYAAVMVLIFAIVAIMHLVRIVKGWPVTIGPYKIPMSVSWAGPLSLLRYSHFGALCKQSTSSQSEKSPLDRKAHHCVGRHIEHGTVGLASDCTPRFGGRHEQHEEASQGHHNMALRRTSKRSDHPQ
jgi:hypothetical protein